MTTGIPHPGCHVTPHPGPVCLPGVGLAGRFALHPSARGWKGADGEEKYLDTRGYYYRRDELFTGIDETAIDFGSSLIDAVNLLNARVTWLYDSALPRT
jgi:hypothetical protein